MWHTHTWEVVRPHEAVQMREFLVGGKDAQGSKEIGTIFHVTMDIVGETV